MKSIRQTQIFLNIFFSCFASICLTFNWHVYRNNFRARVYQYSKLFSHLICSSQQIVGLPNIVLSVTLVIWDRILTTLTMGARILLKEGHFVCKPRNRCKVTTAQSWSESLTWSHSVVYQVCTLWSWAVHHHRADVIGQWKGQSLPAGMINKVSIEGAFEQHLEHR